MGLFVGLLHPDLIRETAKLFGFARVGGNVENAMILGIAKAIEKGYAKWSGERVVCLDWTWIIDAYLIILQVPFIF